MRRFFALGGTTVLVGFVACNSISGSGELHAGGGPTETPSPDDGSGASDSGSGDGVSEKRDAAPDVIIEPPKACPSAGRVCAPAAPPGWEGPLLVYDQTSAGAPACPANMALSKVNAHFGAPSGPHTCSACTCGAPTGVACTTTYRAFDDDGCGDAVGGVQTLTTACKAQDDTVESFIIVGNTASGGSCAKGGGVLQAGDVTWPSALLGCGAPALLTEGCPDGTVCAPEPAAPFRARHCIAQKGEAPCPTTGFTKQLTTGYESVTDTRACAACNCGPPSGVTCNNTVQAYSNSGACNGNARTWAVNSTTCRGEFESASIRLMGAYTTTGGSCAGAGPSAPSGGVAPKDPITVCCLPD